jgi:hypothetical protein
MYAYSAMHFADMFEIDDFDMVLGMRDPLSVYSLFFAPVICLRYFCCVHHLDHEAFSHDD